MFAVVWRDAAEVGEEEVGSLALLAVLARHETGVVREFMTELLCLLPKQAVGEVKVRRNRHCAGPGLGLFLLISGSSLSV